MTLPLPIFFASSALCIAPIATVAVASPYPESLLGSAVRLLGLGSFFLTNPNVRGGAPPTHS